MVGRPPGATNRPQFSSYTNEVDRKAFAVWVKKNYTKDFALARWYGDQLFGKAPQPLSGDPDNPVIVQFHNAVASQKTRGNTTESI